MVKSDRNRRVDWFYLIQKLQMLKSKNREYSELSLQARIGEKNKVLSLQASFLRRYNSIKVLYKEGGWKVSE